ncbi:hypothetical protein FA13DRAFT_1520481 [Coprinellus micaceus]|uniref:Uncharacterized protein n=1 Tax=Coprinellus micaceus TaxID=71717 RepID=A0A4Y7SK32_COPMI|nr:hypothetical protein FA13DRAFT_1520481 [Coprinellus micaceus]
MDNGAYSFLELRRNLQSPTSFQSHASAKSNPPLRKSAPDAENRKPLFNLLYGTQDKPKAGLQVATGTPQRKPSKREDGQAEHFDDGRSNKFSQPRLERFSSPLTLGDPPRPSTSTPFGKDGVDDATRHVFNSYINLKEEVGQLKEQNESVQREYNEVLQERDAARADVENLSVQVQEVSAQAADLRRAVTSYEAKLAESHRKAEAAGHSVGEARDTIETLTFQLQEEKLDKERVRDEIQKLRHSLQDLRFSCEERSSSYADLQERHQALISQVRDYDSLVKGLRASASDALEANKALLQPDGYLTTLREAKSVIGELQVQLESSKEVTNILRDKLHHLASVVAESKARIEELEEEKKTSLAQLHEDYEDLKARNQHSVSLQAKVEGLTDRLVVREMETFDYLATAVATEERLEAANAELERLKGIMSQSEEELVSLRTLKEDHLNKLLASQEVTNGKDKELSVVRTELKSVHESKSELRALWLEAKKTIAEKDEELLKRNPNPELEARVRELGEQLEVMQRDLKKYVFPAPLHNR